MKALIIILALVGLSFVGLLIYGGSGDQNPKRPCQHLKDDGGVPDDWCPPSIAKATRSLQARFAPGLDLPKPGKADMTINPQTDNFFEVPPIADTEKHRTAKLTLLEGGSAVVQLGDKVKQCLCRPGDEVPATMRGDSCGANWQEDHVRKGWICQRNDKWGMIPVEWSGGRLTFAKGPAATVEVK